MDANVKSDLSHASGRNVSLRRVLENLLQRLDAVEQGGGGGASGSPDVAVEVADSMISVTVGDKTGVTTLPPRPAEWAHEGDDHIVPVEKMSRASRPQGRRGGDDSGSEGHSMKVNIQKAKANQLRWYLREKFDIDTHATASRANLIAKLARREPGTTDIEVPDAHAIAKVDAAEAAEVEAAKPEPAKGITGIDPQMIVDALMAQGMDEKQAQEIATRSVTAENFTRELPEGADTMRHWAKIRIERTEEVGGTDPVPVIPNGQTMLIPRGKDIEVRWPYVEVLQHAEKIVYDEVLDADGMHREHVPRIVQTYPFSILKGPYERAANYRPAQQ